MCVRSGTELFLVNLVDEHDPEQSFVVFVQVSVKPCVPQGSQLPQTLQLRRCYSLPRSYSCPGVTAAQELQLPSCPTAAQGLQLLLL